MTPVAGRVADATGNWVDSSAPGWLRPYLRLTRLDRPIGWWLLLLPCWWSSALAAVADRAWGPNPWHILLLLIGSIVMRGAGCTWNDLVDRDIDGRVERTRSRPIPSGQVSIPAAIAFLVLQALVGLLVLLQFNRFAIAVGIASLGVVAIYPFMKRVTYWPQIFLGLAFSWGALMGWAAARGRLDLSAFLLYAGSIAWVMHYDTIYAHQDKEDDALIGVKSTALKLGAATRPWLILFAIPALAFWALAFLAAGLGWAAYLGLAAAAALLARQIITTDFDDPADCLAKFKAHRWLGWMLLAGILLSPWLR
jgi:4-hydroxybenzoate polyprenyltransferase